MKLVFLLATVLLCFYNVQNAEGFYNTELTADQDFLLKQKKIYNLFYHISQPDIVNPELYNEGKKFDIRENIGSYTNQDAVNEFLELYKF